MSKEKVIAKLKADYLQARQLSTTFYADKMVEGWPSGAILEAMKQAQQDMRKEQE